VADSVTKTSPDRPEGEVIASDPPPGQRADKGSTVTLTVSNGPGTAAIPAVEGLSRSRARSRLRDAGFQIQERRESNDTVATGRAIRTSPPEGEERRKGSTVTLLISTGKEQVEIPTVTGQTFEEASAALQAKGFQVARKDQVTDKEDPGTVLAQNPDGGQAVDKGATVTLNVAKEPQDVAVPDVTGETQADAVKRLSREGFEIETQERTVDSQEGDGVVVEQDPAAGRAKKGATVTIIVGTFDPTATPTPTTPDANGGAVPNPPATTTPGTG
jgi:serine/threonine-protein kinase